MAKIFSTRGSEYMRIDSNGNMGIGSQLCRDNKYKNGNRTFYNRDCRYHKEDPTIIVKWMRRNFGERHQGWDFSLVGGCVTIELWDDRLITMYEMWQM